MVVFGHKSCASQSATKIRVSCNEGLSQQSTFAYLKLSPKQTHAKKRPNELTSKLCFVLRYKRSCYPTYVRILRRDLFRIPSNQLDFMKCYKGLLSAAELISHSRQIKVSLIVFDGRNPEVAGYRICLGTLGPLR